MISALALNLLGVGSWIKDFVLQNWKWVVPILILVASYFYVSHLIDESYKNGVAAERTKWEERVKLENEVNRKTEETLKGIIINFGDKLADTAAVRVQKEQTHTDTINNIIREKPIYTECVVDQEVIDMRNKIREMGPSL